MIMAGLIIRSKSVLHLFFFLVVFLSLQNNIKLSLGTSSSTVAAAAYNEREKKALLTFKHDLNDPLKLLSSWDAAGNKDCCKWTRVVCNNNTGLVHELHLRDIGLSGELNPSLLELKHLHHLDLSYNHFNISIPPFLGSLQNLRYLDLGSNAFVGMIPPQLGNLTNLRHLSMSFLSKLNSGDDLEWLSHLSSLQHLDMSYVNLSKASSNWLHSINSLPSLLELDLQNCDLCSVPSLSYVNFTSLTSLVLSHNNLFNTYLPEWLYILSNLVYLDLSYCHFQKTISEAVGNLTSLTTLRLGKNELEGRIPSTLGNLSNLKYLDLSGNKLSGELPYLLTSSNMVELDLSNNSFSGSISILLCDPLNEGKSLKSLDLSRNVLYGELPQCWFYWKDLQMIKLEHNNITGKIPNSMGSLLYLQSLHLRNNSLFGEVPSSLQNCTELTTIDLCDNAFAGSIPTWMGESLPKLTFLSLCQNKFYGGIPQELCHLPSLRLLDLAHNHLSGSIPRCFSNFTAMALKKQESSVNNSPTLSSSIRWVETASVVIKGRQIEYTASPLGLATSIDLSNNSLSGEIPEELTSLFGLRSLNLSENLFTGKIPKTIGGMDSLESLDFSNNKLTGEIPQSMKDLTFLGHLNMSCNNLSGEIPSGTQLQSFNESSYMGNQGLCGPPLKNCSEDKQPQPPGDEDDNWLEKNCFYISLTLGFVIAFWGFWGVLLVNKSWRFAYFRFLDNTWDKLCN